MNQDHFRHFQNFFPEPPSQGPIGQIPALFLNELAKIYKINLSLIDVDPNRQLERQKLREICRNPKNSDLALYSAIMAWGGRNMKNFRYTLENESLGNLIQLIQFLRSTEDSRERVYAETQQRVESIKGLGISFFTKLMYFLRAKSDAYILDQFTAKSVVLLFPASGIRLSGSGMPHAKTSPEQYEAYCGSVENLADSLGSPWTPDTSEQALFGKGSQWRKYIQPYFEDHVQRPSNQNQEIISRKQKLAQRIAILHSRSSGYLDLPGIQPTITNTNPVRAHCLFRLGVIWQYAIQLNSVHAEIFLSRNRRADYDHFCREIGIADGVLGENIRGTALTIGSTASIKITTELGANSEENQWEEIARLAVDSMNNLFERFGEIF